MSEGERDRIERWRRGGGGGVNEGERERERAESPVIFNPPPPPNVKNETLHGRKASMGAD